MGTALTPDLEAGGSSDTPSGSADPLDAFDITSIDRDIIETEDTQLPDGMLVSRDRKATPGEEAAEPIGDETAEQAAARVRNDKGQFAKKDGAPDPATAGQPAAAEKIPFRYRAMGNTHDLEGATTDAQGNLTVPAAKVASIREALNAFHVASAETFPTLQRTQTENQQLRQRLESIGQERTLADTRAEQLTSALSQAMAEPDDAKFIEAVFGLRQNWANLTARAEAAYWKTQAERGAKAPPAAAPKEQAPAATARTMPPPEAAVHSTREFVEDAKVDHTFHDLTPADWKQYEQQIAGTPYAFLRLATAEDAKQHEGVQVGEVVFDTDMAATHVRAFASARRQARETAKGQTALAADTARRTQPKIDTPPSPTAGKTPAKGKGASGSFSTKKEYDAWLESDEL